MKKTLLYLAIALMSVSAITAQTVWNFGGDATTFPVSTGIGTGPFPVVVAGLAMVGISTNGNMGAVNASAKTFTDANNVSYSFTNRFQFNGAGYAGALNTDLIPTVNMPSQRYLWFNVKGNSTIYFIGITGSSSAARKIFVTDGVNYVGGVDFPASTALNDGTVNYTGPATTLYVYCNAACNLEYMSATNVALTAAGVTNILADKGISFNGKEITNKNNLEIEVYNVLGKKLATSKTNISTANLQKGVYIVKAAGSNGAMKFSI